MVAADALVRDMQHLKGGRRILMQKVCRIAHRLQWMLVFTMLQDPKLHIVTEPMLIGLLDEK